MENGNTALDLSNSSIDNSGQARVTSKVLDENFDELAKRSFEKAESDLKKAYDMRRLSRRQIWKLIAYIEAHSDTFFRNSNYSEKKKEEYSKNIVTYLEEVHKVAQSTAYGDVATSRMLAEEGKLDILETELSRGVNRKLREIARADKSEGRTRLLEKVLADTTDDLTFEDVKEKVDRLKEKGQSSEKNSSNSSAPLKGQSSEKNSSNSSVSLKGEKEKRRKSHIL